MGQVRVAVFPGSISARAARISQEGAPPQQSQSVSRTPSTEKREGASPPGTVPVGPVGPHREAIPAVLLGLGDGGVAGEVERRVLVEGQDAAGLPGAVQDRVDSLGRDHPPRPGEEHVAGGVHLAGARVVARGPGPQQDRPAAEPDAALEEESLAGRVVGDEVGLDLHRSARDREARPWRSGPRPGGGAAARREERAAASPATCPAWPGWLPSPAPGASGALPAGRSRGTASSPRSAAARPRARGAGSRGRSSCPAGPG